MAEEENRLKESCPTCGLKLGNGLPTKQEMLDFILGRTDSPPVRPEPIGKLLKKSKVRPA